MSFYSACALYATHTEELATCFKTTFSRENYFDCDSASESLHCDRERSLGSGNGNALFLDSGCGL